MASSRPEDEFILVGRNSGQKPQDVWLPPNVSNPWTELQPMYREASRTWYAVDERRKTGKQVDYTIHMNWMRDNVLPMFEELDALIVWAGQHGTSNSPIPQTGGGTWKPEDLTHPQESALFYGGYLIWGINVFRKKDPLTREEMWLCPDPRNYLKARDLKWPVRNPILSQYAETRRAKFERYGDTRTPQECGFDARAEDSVWIAQTNYVYSGLELTALPLPENILVNTNPGEHQFGMIINENRPYVSRSRLQVMKQWVVPFWPEVPIRGKWSEKSEVELGRKIAPVPITQMYDVARSYRSTLTTPASGSYWATAKPWEAFAVGSVCFFHPYYDTQGHIIPTLEQVEDRRVHDADLAQLARFLRVRTPEELYKRVLEVEARDDIWTWVTYHQRRHFEQRFAQRQTETIITERLEAA
jgi:hypothetical protein